MKGKQSHYDAWGNPTLDYFSMLNYYKQDNVSITVLRNNPPCRYAVIPHVEIHIDRECPELERIYLIYPGGQVVKEGRLNLRAIDALRRVYREKRAGWRVEVTSNEVIFRRKGRVIPLAFSRFGIVDTH